MRPAGQASYKPHVVQVPRVLADDRCMDRIDVLLVLLALLAVALIMFGAYGLDASLRLA